MFAVMPSMQLTRSVLAGVRHPGERLQDAVRDHGLEGVELQLAALRGGGHRGIRPDHAERDLVDDLGDDRVHLAGHDRRTGLTRGKVDLAEAGLRAAREQPKVVADLRELDRGALQDAAQGHEDAGVRGGLDEVGRGDHVECR